jgi:hypothetical protein
VDEAHEAAPERRSHDALARCGEDQLLDQLAHVVGLRRVCGAAAVADVERERNLDHVPLTRTCVTITFGGPCGAAPWQIPLEVWRIAGWPFTVTRVAGTSHCTFRHGCGALPTTNEQPAIMNVSAIVATGCPLTVTRVFDVITLIWPP